MKNTLLYIATVLIWGSTWLAIEFQLGEVDVPASVAYRFMIAAVLMWGYCFWAKVPMTFSVANHFFILVLAIFNFSINYAVVYSSQQYLSSAMASIAFSTMLLMNIVNTRIFFGTKITAKTYIGALLGIFGITALFWDDLSVAVAGSESLLGLSLVISAALIASLGNMASVRNSRAKMNIFAVNAWGMLYGAIILTLIVIVSDAQFGFSMQPSYIGSLLYLAIFGTVIAFATYYDLLNDMGPEKASYVIVLFPVVAVVLSSIFEDFIWTTNTFIGFALVLLGNAIILAPSETLRRFSLKPRVGRNSR
ncbi:MAG: drug/metabolite transporter (DMT)-like permease [Arenicella sp.]|jgi:drug/metabolite transporter (DMT)-like permease